MATFLVHRRIDISSSVCPRTAQASKVLHSTGSPETRKAASARGLVDAVILAIPGDEPGNALFDRSRWREADVALQRRDIGDGVFDVAGLHRQQIHAGRAPERLL